MPFFDIQRQKFLTLFYHFLMIAACRSTGCTHSDVWSAAADNDHVFIRRWTAIIRRRHTSGRITRKRRGYGIASTASSRNTKNTLTCTVPSVAQRRLQSGTGFVVLGRPGDGGGALGMPLNVDEPEVWSGWTALMCAAAGGHTDVVAALLAAGASPMTPSCTEARVTAGHVAAQQGRLNVLQLVMQVAPKVVYKRNLHHKTPLHMACETNRVQMVEWLLDNDATEDHGLVGMITEEDEESYTENISEVLAIHRKTHSDRKFVLRAQQMRASLGF
jgi:hypothetical protein